VLGEPTGRFGHLAPDPPDEEGAQHRNSDHPAPASDHQGIDWDELPGEKGGKRDSDELDRLIDGKSPAANRLGHELADVGIDGDQLDADADAGDEAPQQDAAARILRRHDASRQRIPEQRVGEDHAPPEFVGDGSENDRPKKQANEGA
jgi:hypothetical protein